MVDDAELERDLGRATIVYETPDEDLIERTIPNEHAAYFQDHWLVKIDEDEQDHDVVRRIPRERVWYVERSVDEFEDEVETIQSQLQSIADDLRSKVLGAEGNPDDGDGTDSDAHRIDIESDDPDDER